MKCARAEQTLIHRRIIIITTNYLYLLIAARRSEKQITETTKLLSTARNRSAECVFRFYLEAFFVCRFSFPLFAFAPV